jgi:hypothetical protein
MVRCPYRLKPPDAAIRQTYYLAEEFTVQGDALDQHRKFAVQPIRVTLARAMILIFQLGSIVILLGKSKLQ